MLNANDIVLQHLFFLCIHNVAISTNCGFHGLGYSLSLLSSSKMCSLVLATEKQAH